MLYLYIEDLISIVFFLINMGKSIDIIILIIAHLVNKGVFIHVTVE